MVCTNSKVKKKKTTTKRAEAMSLKEISTLVQVLELVMSMSYVFLVIYLLRAVKAAAAAIAAQQNKEAALAEEQHKENQKLATLIAAKQIKEAQKLAAAIAEQQSKEAQKPAPKKAIAMHWGRPAVETNAFEDAIGSNVVDPTRIDVTLDSVGGLDSVKKSLHELLILPLQRPQLFADGKLLRQPKGVLLHGPPGTGKTTLAKAIAKESGAVFINVKMSTLKSKWFGDADKYVNAVFSLAYKLQPAIIFIDEVDGFLGKRNSSEFEALKSMKTEFMALWDGLTTDQKALVVVLGATNRPDDLDEAILRRFSRTFEVGVPGRSERAKILKVILKDEKVEEDINYDHIAGLCEGYTGSKLLDLCKQAAYFPVKEVLCDEENGRVSDGEKRALKQSDLENALSELRAHSDQHRSIAYNGMYV